MGNGAEYRIVFRKSQVEIAFGQNRNSRLGTRLFAFEFGEFKVSSGFVGDLYPKLVEDSFRILVITEDDRTTSGNYVGTGFDIGPFGDVAIGELPGVEKFAPVEIEFGKPEGCVGFGL